jgi:hypothetical protein
VHLVTLRPVRLLLAAAAVGLLVLAGVLTVPDLVSDEDAGAAPRPPECVARATAPAGEIGTQAATWVRFCPLADEGAAQRVRHPQGVITGDLAEVLAATLWQTQEDRRVCEVDRGPTPGPARRFRIEVGLADGRIAELRGDTGCSTRDITLFSQLETTLLMAAGGAGTDVPPSPVRCPRRFTTAATNADGRSADQLVDTAEHPWQSTVPLLPLPAVAVDVCAYAGDGARRDLVDQWRTGPPVADALRARATIGYGDGQTDCALDPRATSYVVVLHDATGTARTLALDPTQCATLQAAIGTPASETYLGLASPHLVRSVARSAP